MNSFVPLGKIALAAAITVALGGCNDDGDTTEVTENNIENTTVISPSYVNLRAIGRYDSGMFDVGAAEIVAFDAGSARVFVINAEAAAVDVLDLSDPSNPTKVGHIDATALGDGANSVAVHDGVVAVAIERETAADDGSQDNGVVAFYNAADLSLLGSITVGALPDMVTFTPNGNFALVANEGEPNDDYDYDPVGSVSVIDLRGGVASASVATAGFGAFNGRKAELQAAGVRIFGPGASVAQDLEPEYIAVSADSSTAWVTLQENNALAVVDIASATVTDILPLGYKNHALLGNELDASDKDDMINIRNWPVMGMYMPDAIASYSFNGQTFLVTANEGDARDYDGYSEEERVEGLDLDPAVFGDVDTLQQEENLGRLSTTSANGDTDGDGLVETIYAYGARSFSIWNAEGNRVFDSGNQMELITAGRHGMNFNNDNDENDGDSRSDAKGPEPEGVTVGTVEGRTYAFIGLERMSGIMVYDVTNPEAPTFVQYLNDRDFDQRVCLDPVVDGDELVCDEGEGSSQSNPAAGDLGPEGLTFVSAEDSPNGKPLLLVGSEITGSTVVYAIDVVTP